MEFGAVAVWVEVSWKIERMRMKEVGFKNENHCNRDHSVGQHEVYAIHMVISRLAPENSAGWDRRGWGLKRLRNHENQPPSCLNEFRHGSTRKRHLHVAKRP